MRHSLITSGRRCEWRRSPALAIAGGLLLLSMLTACAQPIATGSTASRAEQMAAMEDARFCEAVANLVRFHSDDPGWRPAVHRQVEQRYSARGVVCDGPTPKVYARQAPAAKQANSPQHKPTAEELRRAEQQVFERLIAEARAEAALNVQRQAEYQAAIERARIQANRDAASDALIAAGLGLMARQPAPVPVSPIIDCTVMPGNNNRNISCW